MRLAKDTCAGARSVYVSCVSCSKRVRLCNTWADLDGAAFVDYYCDDCERKHIDNVTQAIPHFVDGIEVRFDPKVGIWR